MDFGELESDLNIKEKVTNIHNSVEKIRDILEKASKSNVYEELNSMDKINYDLFLSYSLNTLYWLYLRTKGIDPNQNDIKNELSRVREYMIKAKDAHERNTIRPKLSKDLSKKFVRNALFDVPKEGRPPNKKKKFH